MKRVLYIIPIIMLLIITGCSKGVLNTLTIDELNKKINNKESFVVYFEVEDSTLKEKLEKVLTDNNLTGYLVKDSKLTSEDKYKLQPTITYENSSIVFIVEGKDSSILSHVTDSSTTIKEIELRLKDMNFIK